MTVQLSEDQITLLNTIAQQNGITDFEVETSPASGKGENFLGVITRVIIKNNDRKLDLILKSAPSGEIFRKMFPIHKAYNREISTYQKIFVEFKAFQEEFNISDPFTSYAKFYGSSLEEGNEWLLMEDVTAKGYGMWNRQKTMTAEHIKAVLIEYAKFHAVSLAMQQKKPELYNELTNAFRANIFQLDDGQTDRKDAAFKSLLDNGSKILADEPKMLENFIKIFSAIEEQFREKKEDDRCHIVVNHGDNWCNNLMFKHEESEDTTKLPKVCILDWQLTKKGSPAEDLTYFFLVHSPKEVLYNYKHYLTIYHDTLCKNLRDFSCDPEEVFPRSFLDRHWKAFIHYGLFMSLMILKMMYCDSDEAVDFNEISESGEDFINGFNFEIRNVKIYHQRIKDIMQFLEDNDMIDIVPRDLLQETYKIK